MTELFWLKAYIKSQIELHKYQINSQALGSGAKVYNCGCICAYTKILRKLEEAEEV